MNENAKIFAEEILTLMVFGLDLLSMPTLNKWNRSYDGWPYANGLLHRMQYLKTKKHLTYRQQNKMWIYQLTQLGRDASYKNRDPEICWQRKWDGWWRQLVFDLPIGQQPARISLIRWLRRNGFGYLQDSVWISPDPVKKIADSMKAFSDDAESFTILECRCADGFSDSALVKGAWPLIKMNEYYHDYQKFVASIMKQLCAQRLHPKDLFSLLKQEKDRWFLAFSKDPLLPQKLYPAHYAGFEAWETRRKLFRLIASQIASV